MSFLKGLGYAIKVFFHDPVAYVRDPAGAIVDYSVQKEVEAGTSYEVIATSLEEKGFVEGSTWEDLKKVGDGVLKGSEFLFKHGVLILVLVLAAWVVFYVLRLRKVVA